PLLSGAGLRDNDPISQSGAQTECRGMSVPVRVLLGGGRSPAYLSLLTPSLTAKVRDARVPSCCDGKAAYRRRSPGRPGILPGQPFVLGMGRDPAQGGVRLHHVVPELHPLLLVRPALAGGPQQLQRTFLVSRALPPVLLRAGDEGIGPRRVVEQAVSRNL